MLDSLPNLSYDGPRHFAVAAAFEDTFSLPFILWSRENEWVRIFHRGFLAAEATSPQIPEEMLSAGRVWSTELEEGYQRLEIPIPHDHGGWVVGTLEIHSQEPDLLLRLGQALQRNVASNRDVQRQQVQIDALCEQINDDLEEICLLREVAEQLELSDATIALTEMAQIVFPILRPSIRAESVVLLPAARNEPALTIGPKTVAESTYWLLVDRFGSNISEEPVVRNVLDRNDDATDYPNVRDFILVPITRKDHQSGWLLALNRVIPNGFDKETRPPLSQFEFGTNEAGLLCAIASMFATQSRNIKLFQEKESLLTNAVRTLVSVVEAKDAYTCGHSERVALFGKRLAQEIGITNDECNRLYLAGLLHDVGKIGVPDSLLRKSSRLTDEEFEEVKRHPEVGWAILHELDQLQYVLPGVIHHHERYDGEGYPDKLAGEEIPLAGRILAVADAYDAMTSDRPYRRGMPHKKAISILDEGKGTQWDPLLVESFMRITPEILTIRETYQRELPASRDRVTRSSPTGNLSVETLKSEAEFSE